MEDKTSRIKSRRSLLRVCVASVILAGLDMTISSVRALSGIGGSSFVRKQQQQRRDGLLSEALQRVPSGEQVLELARRNEGRIRGSNKCKSAWRQWMEQATATIRQDLSNNLPYPVEPEELAQLSFALGVAADKGYMPKSFANPGARAGYALDYFCRARLLAGFLMDTDNPSLPSFWDSEASPSSYCPRKNDAISFFTGNADRNSKSRNDTSTKTVFMTSIGGGPGFDFVAAVMVATFAAAGETTNLPAFRATILDYEEGWGDLVVAMGESTTRVLQSNKKWGLEWGGKCDITLPLKHSDNAACRQALSNTDLWTCQYCVAENAQKLRASNYIFFRDLFDNMTVGSIVIVTETTPRLWPEFYDMIQEHCPFMEVGFPNQRGPQLLLRKRFEDKNKASLTLTRRDEILLQEFREISMRHEERLCSGWERQVNKRLKVEQDGILAA